MHTEITWDDSAAVFEAWLVAADGAREWLGCADTRAAAQALIDAAQ